MSRPIERIKPFLEKVDLNKLLGDIWCIFKDDDIQSYSKIIYTDLPKIKEFWIKNPDLRFSQVLVNMGILPNIPGGWYYWEEPEILIELDYKPEDVYYWGVFLDKNNIPLLEPFYKPISELNSDHLRTIINGGFVKHNKLYRQLMLKVLRKRRERL